MAAANQLDKIAGLAERLAPLAGKTRGMKIEADEWNTLVDALRGVLEIERVQENSVSLMLEEKYAQKGHQHLGEVSLNWLDAELQSQLGGGGSSFALRAAFTELEKKVTSLATEVTRLNAVVEQQQRKLDETSVNEIDRTRQLRSFDERFASVENLRTVFATMSGQFQNLSQNVTTVLDLRKRLTDAQGQPIDFADMNRRLSDVQKLSDSLRGADNVPLRLRDFDARLRGVEDALNVGAGRGLNERFTILTADIDTRFNTKLNERVETVRTGLLQGQEEQATRLKETVRVGLENVKAETVKLVDTQLKSSQTVLTTQLDDRVKTVREQLRLDATNLATSRVDARFAELDLSTRVKTQVDASRVEIETGLRTQLTESLKGTLSTQIAGVEQTLTARVAAAEGLATKVNQDLPARVKAEVAGATASLSADVDKRVGERLAKAPELLEPVITTKVNAAFNSTVGQLNERVDKLVQQQVGDVNARVSSAVAAGLKSVPDVVSGEVQTRFAALKVDEQFNQLRSTLTTSLTAQVNQSVAELRAKVSTNEAAVSELRGQVVVSQRTANDAILRATTVEGKLGETNRDIDTRFKNINTRPVSGPILDRPNIIIK
jgi:hypothetical protein